jgi:hypothetical protein
MTPDLPLPSWLGVATSLLFIVLVALLAARQKLHLTGNSSSPPCAPPSNSSPSAPCCW